jgi:hypothetical protein
VAIASLDRRRTFLRFDESTTMRSHRYADRSSVVRIETAGPVAGNYRVWVD